MRSSVDFNLRDQNNDGKFQRGTVKTGPNEVEVFLDGHGVKTMKPGRGSVVLVEFFEGKPRVVVWADVNQEDPTHIIELDGASEARRNEVTKTFEVLERVGKARYVVNHHDGHKAHKDGSPFFDVTICKNKPKLAKFVADLKANGYVECSTRAPWSVSWPLRPR